MKPNSLNLRIYLAVSLLSLLTAFFSSCAGPRTAARPTSVYATTSVSRPHTVFHTVGPSETLWRISKTYGVDMDTILRANQLTDPSMIKNGQQLVIPQTKGPKLVIPLYPNPRWTYIVIHHTATHEGSAFAIDQLHHKRGFWNGLGYHFLINNGTDGTEDGQLQVGPRWVKQQDGAHANADGMNQRGIGIVLVGNFSETRVSESELSTLVFLVNTLQKYYNIPDNHVIGHRDVVGKNTECPGNLFPWKEFKKRLSRAS